MNETNPSLEEEIDLRQYVSILIKYKYWIIGLAVVSALVAFVVSSFMPKTYEAKAVVTATQSRYELQFDPRFRDIPDSAIQSLLESQYRTFPTLATSDSLLRQVAEKTGWDFDTLKQSTEVLTQSDAPNMLILAVKGQSTTDVTNVSNTWAEIFVTSINDLYGGGDELEQYKQQKEAVKESLDEADKNLTTFRKKNGFGFNHKYAAAAADDDDDDDEISQWGLIGQRLQSRNNLLTNYEAELIRLRQMKHEIELLSKTTSTNTSPALIAGLLSEMLNTGIIETSQPYQIKLDSVEPTTGLAAMAQALEARATAIEAEIDSLETDIANLQDELATKQEELENLIRDRDVKAETYAVISRKVQEAQIDAFGGESSNAGKVQIASQAVMPTTPISPGRLRNTIVAGVLGLMVGIFGTLAWEWWRSANETDTSPGK